MLKINKNNAIVGLLGFLPALLTTRLTSLGDILIFYVIMLAYTAFFVFCKEEVFPYENEGEYVPVSREAENSRYKFFSDVLMVFGDVQKRLELSV